MPEIVVRAKHEDLVQKWTLGFLRFTFPFWGVVSPIIFFAVFCGWLATIYAELSNKTDIIHQTLAQGPLFLSYVGYTLCFLAVPAGALSMMRMIRKNHLIFEKNGIIFPIETFHFRLRRFLPWSEVKKIEVRRQEGNESWQSKSIVLYTQKGKVDRLKLGYYQSSEVEQMLVAVETWGQGVELDESVKDLHQQLRKQQSTVEGLSYTDMWEDELRRRYNPTAYVPLDPGLILHNGELKVLRQLATGGLSAIYLVQAKDQKLAVLKEAVLPEDAAESVRAKAQELFEREAQILKKLSHANVVKVLDHFIEGGRNYMLMEYIPGQDLRQFIRQNGPQRETVVVDWAIQIVSIIKYLHELDPPVIHRDLTPDNLVLREDGNLVLIDFGAANEFISKGTGTFVGKQSFIAPEQFRGKAVLQSDIYALGCTLFFMLTGKEPEALECSSPRNLDAKISQELDELVQCCTQLDPRDRFQSATQLLPVLRKIAASLLGVV